MYLSLLLKKHASILYLLLLYLSLFSAERTQAQPLNSVLDTKRVTISKKNAPLYHILEELERQTHWLINTPRDGKQLSTLEGENITLRVALDKLFGKQQADYIVLDHLSIIKVVPRQGADSAKNPVARSESPGHRYRISGRVMDEEGNGLPGATLQVKGTTIGIGADSTGHFAFSVPENQLVLISTYIGYENIEVAVLAGKPIDIVLRKSNRRLDEVTIVGYMGTSKRNTTGSVYRISAADIEGSPVGNPLLSLQGKVPGLILTQSSGVAGASIRVNLRGVNSLFNGSQPLYIVNGVQLPIYGEQINQLSSVASQNENGGITPFSMFGLNDIESIDILKDAVATAAYGSRGANGVVIINTKKGLPGKLRVTVNYMRGISNVSRKLSLLNTREYVAMRKEAFRNDGITLNKTPGTPGYAPDILLWDTTRYTNWPKLLTGRNASLSDLNIGVSGGTEYTRLLLSTGIYNEQTVYSKDMAYLRSTINLAVDHRSKNSKFKMGVYANYSVDNNQLFNPSSPGELLPPNTAGPYDEHHNLVWQEGGEQIVNPMAERLKQYAIVKNNLIVNVSPSYELFAGFKLKTSIGCTGINVYENSRIPIAAQNPDADSTRTGSSFFATGKYRSVLIDPVAEYTRKTRIGDIVMLAGYSFQYANSVTTSETGLGYMNDNYLRIIDSATYKIATVPDHNVYKYGAFFTQLNYQYKGRYIVDLTFRRDGSSKFSPERRFGNFWAAGGAWVFSNEKFFDPGRSVLSYAKLRSSIGVTGNDKIANYKYLDTWSPVPGGPYQGIPGLSPDALYNPAYSWETCRKIEMGLDLELKPADMLLSVSYFNNRSSNQLVKYNLASQTGFNSILKNIDAVIRNRGWEFTMDASLYTTRDFRLSGGFNFTLPQNTLLRFDKLATSYYGTYVIGQSVEVLNRLRSEGVNPQTGIFTLRDKDNNDTYNATDYEVIGHLDPSFYGSVRLGLTWKALSVTMLGDFRNQMAPNYLHAIYINNVMPGTAFNQSVEVLDRWQKPGDIAQYPRYSTSPGGEVYADRRLMVNSDRAYSDASFFKLRNLYVYYTLNSPGLVRIKVENLRIYCKGQNLFTMTKYKGGDPETASPLSLASLRTITLGLQATF